MAFTSPSIHLTSCEALEICRDFLGGSWNLVSSDNISFKIHKKALANRHYEISLADDVITSESEHRKVFITLYGGPWTEVAPHCLEELMTMSRVVAPLVCDAIGKQLGNPRILGIFDGGRIEEFLQHEVLPLQLVADNDVCEVVCRQLARIHTTKVPISAKLFDCNQKSTKLVQEDAELLANMSDQIPQNLRDHYNRTSKFNFEKSVAFLKKIEAEMNCELVTAHLDMNPSNVVLRTGKSSSELMDRLVILDFEYAAKCYTGIDISNFLMQRSINFSDFANPLTGIPSPTIEQKLIAVTAYVKERQNIDGLDKIETDKLLKEVLFCGLVNRIFLVAFTIRFTIHFKLYGFLEMSTFMLDEYEKEKHEFLELYKNV